VRIQCRHAVLTAGMYSTHWGMSACALYEAGPLMGIWSACSDTVESLICILTALIIYCSLESYLCHFSVCLSIAS
jgi:hypothetical protein